MSATRDKSPNTGNHNSTITPRRAAKKKIEHNDNQQMVIDYPRYLKISSDFESVEET